MKRQVIIIGVIIVIGIGLLGCGSSETVRCGGESKEALTEKRPRPIGMPNPSAVYCVKLGYKFEVVTDEEGSQYGVCIFPDGNAFLAWDFYRGKAGQEWSYCNLQGYDLKELGPREGWFKGAICIDKTTKEEIGTVYDLFVEE